MTSTTLVRAFAAPFLLAGYGLAQTPASAPAKPMAFEVVSIRQDSGQGNKQFQFEATPTGYRITAAPMLFVVMTAYPPASGASFFIPTNVQGAPDWAQKDRYNVEAKVSASDLADWQNPARQPEMIHAMLQTMLVERLKLAVHRDTKEESVYSLVVAKSGPKMKESVPGEPHPAGRSLPGGAVMGPKGPDGTVPFYAIDMPTFAALLSDLGGRQVLDETRLTAKYDFAIQQPANPDVGNARPGGDATDPGPTIFSVLSGLGLRLDSAKRQVETLVIDHMEPPTEN